MGVEGLHFAEPFWLWGLLAPLILWWLPRRGLRHDDRERLGRYADTHLLPHLLVEGEIKRGKRRRRFTLWAVIWSLGILAMAGPRWDFREVNLFHPGTDLVILLDLSRSMEAKEGGQTRLARARQEIEDLLAVNPNVRVGLIAFATVAHVVTPITDDLNTLRHILPSLNTELVHLQGSRLSSALERAHRLLLGQPPGSNHELLLISDGDFVEPGLEEYVKKLRALGVRLHVLGVGTPQGAPIPASRGGWLHDARGKQVISRLEEKLLRSLAAAGGGLYQRADYLDEDTHNLLREILQDTPGQSVGYGELRIWHERYYLLIGLMMVLVLIWFRRRQDTVARL